MSAIVLYTEPHCDGNVPLLIADNMGISTRSGDTILFPMKKLHISKCKRMAFAYCGAYLYKEQLKQVTDFLLLAAINYETSDNPNDMVLEFPSVPGEIVDNSIFVMTANSMYTYSRGESIFNRVEWTCYAGTHGLAAACLLNHSFANESEESIGMTIANLGFDTYGYDERFVFEYVKQDSLVPIVEMEDD